MGEQPATTLQIIQERDLILSAPSPVYRAAFLDTISEKPLPRYEILAVGKFFPPSALPPSLYPPRNRSDKEFYYL